MKIVSCRLVMLAAIALAAGACATPERHGRGPGGPGLGGGPGGMRFGFAGFQDGYVARPIALLFIDMDANHDRVLTSDELAKGIAAEFDHADADHNGVISGFEMADWDKAVLGNSEALPNRAEMDVDLSSTISRNEFENALRKEFVAMDKDNDGKLTRAELLIEVPGRAEGPSGEVRNGDGGGQPQGGGGRGRGGGRRGGGGGGGQGPF